MARGFGGFESSLFINCPFDREYVPLLHSLIFVVFEKERYRYQRVLSDISGNDIRAHGGDPQVLIGEVRNWLRVVTDKPLPSGSSLWASFNLFRIYLKDTLGRDRYSERDIQALEFVEYVDFIRDWKVSGSN